MLEYFIHRRFVAEVVVVEGTGHFLLLGVPLLLRVPLLGVSLLVVAVVVIVIVFHVLILSNYNEKRLVILLARKLSTPMHIQIKDIFMISDHWTYLWEFGVNSIIMDLEWLWLIIPGGYLALSTFFLCLPNILHRRQRYQYDVFNQLVETPSLFCIGHRGGAFEGPENTLQVFKATSRVSHMFELDICVTKDGKLVVHHDTNLKRTCGVDKLINELTSD
jgi:lysophospholipase D